RSSWCTGSFAGLLMFLNQGLQNGTSHEQGVAAGVYTIVRDATNSFSTKSWDGFVFSPVSRRWT
ncbi:hypothetical protein, partial [Extensimonas perlucida]|uniref:hypothetical protein n=1 Tax=Extensimonas perlucida TaxID=2590786 RepID=UPI001C92C3DA